MSEMSFPTDYPASTAPVAPEVLLYHRVAEGSLDNQYLSVSLANFEAHLDILCHERKVMPLFDLVQAGLKGHLPEGGVAITFDDGYADNLLNALPLLEKYHCHATIFVTAGLLGHPYGFWYDVLEDVLLGQRDLPPTLQVPLLNEALPLTSPEEILGTHELLLELCKKAPVRMRRVLLHEVVRAAGLDPAAYSSPHPLLTQEQVAELAASPWIEIGAHTMTHAVLSGLDEAGQRREIVDSVRMLEECIGKPVRILAYPFGNRGAYNDVTKKVTAEAGLLGIANIQGSLVLGAGEPNTPNRLDPQDVPRRLVRNWAGADFRRWLRATDRHQLERETVGGRADMLLGHVRRVRGVRDMAVLAKTPLADENFRIEPLSRVFGLDRPGGKPLDRVYIERFLAAEAAHIRGRVMEVAADTYTQKFGRGVTRCDILHAQSTPEATLVGDLATGEGIPRAAFDCIILTQTIQFIYDVHAALRHATAALAPGGVLLLTASGISQISRYDMDRWGEYWRFTDKALARMLHEAAPECDVEVQAFGNAGTARAFLDGRSADEVPAAAFEHNDPDYQVTLCARVTRPRENSMDMSGDWKDITVPDDMAGLHAYARAHRHGRYRVHFRGLIIHCIDLLSFYMAGKDIFVQGIYDFTCANPTPFVIDGGAHIGLFTLRVKQLYPQARVLAFEPDDEARALFELNLAANEVGSIQGVEVIPAGLHDSDGTLSFSSRGDDGNTLYSEDCNTTVRVTRLSRHMNVPVDFLKLNIEGGELPVLAECAERLRNVEQIVLEYHGFPELGDRLHLILDILHRQGFRYMIHDFDAQTNAATKPPFRIDAATRYFLLVAARRLTIEN